MAYAFAATSNQYLNTSSSPLSAGDAFTLSIMFNVPVLGVLFAVADSLGYGTRILSDGVDKLRLFIEAPTGNILTTTVVAPTPNTWQHAAGTRVSSTSANVYLNGANKNTSTGVSTFVTTEKLGIFANAYGSSFLNGNGAEAAVWKVGLTDDEIVSLAKGFKPTRIRPQSLVFYAPLIRNLQDIKGALTLTNNNGATVAHHPRVY